MKYLFLFLFPFFIFSQVGIGTTNPDNSSKLDIVSNSKGILIPRMTVVDRVAISTAAKGLLVYQTDDVEGFYYYDGLQWNRLLDRKNDVPAGSIFTFATSTVPNGFLACNGAAVSRTLYAELFSIIGVTYGAGDGSTTFNLPDYRGYFLRGYDNGAGNDPDAVTRLDSGDGVTTGDNVGTKQPSSNMLHTHTTQPSAINTTIAGSHLHNISNINTFTSLGGNHNHYFSKLGTTSGSGIHNHQITLKRRTASTGAFSSTYFYGPTGSNTNINTDSAGTHYHTYNIQGYTQNNGTHNHNVYIPSHNTNSTGNHAHGVSIPALNVNASTGSTESRPKNISVLYGIKY